FTLIGSIYRALTSAACLARSADRARLCLIQSEFQRLTYAEPGEVLTSSGPSWALSPLHQPHRGTGIRPDRDIAARRSDIKTSRRLYRRGRQAIRAQTRAESRVLDLRKRLRKRDRLSAGGSRIRTLGPPAAVGSVSRHPLGSPARDSASEWAAWFISLSFRAASCSACHSMDPTAQLVFGELRFEFLLRFRLL